MSLRILILSFLVSSRLFAAESPYAAESRVRTDLDALLSRLLLPDQYLLNVNIDVSYRTQKRIVDAETIVEGGEEAPPPPAPPEPMPGFVPEVLDPPIALRSRPKTMREHYATVETPNLNFLRVDVTFDNVVTPEMVAEAKRLVHGYLLARYPQEMRLNFFVVNMRKPPPPKEEPKALPPPPPAPEPPKEPTLEERIQKLAPWIALFLVSLALLFKNRTPKQPPQPKKEGQSQFPLQFPFQFTQPQAPQPTKDPKSITEALRALRERFLEKIIRHTEPFRLYYERLSKELKAEIETVLAGPALDSVMEGLKLERAGGNLPDSPELGERMVWHEKQFGEFIQAAEWQEQQLFGFMHHLTKERLSAIANFESDVHVALMLRFLPPTQSAGLLDSLPEEKRQRVLSHMIRVNRMPLSEIVMLEKSIRGAVQRVPAHMMGVGAKEIDFWGELLSESQHGQEILDELERTKPEYGEGLKKYRFTLEDVPKLPTERLSKVIAEMDNEELCLALSVCPETVTQVIVKALGEKRRDVIKRQLPLFKNAGGDKATEARSRLTRKLREASIAA